jgi:hypothetical protein
VTRRCLVALGREQELQDYDTEQQRRTPRDPAGRWLWVVVGFDLIVMVGALLLYFSD